MKATARLIHDITRGTARITDIGGLRKFLRVWPSKPQEVTWLRMEDTIEYHVESNTQWRIE